MLSLARSARSIGRVFQKRNLLPSTSVVQRFSFHSSTFTRDEEKPAAAPLAPNVQEIVDKILTLNIIETISLVDHLKDKFGYVESQVVAAAGPAGAAPVEEEEAAPEQTIFTVKLEKFDAKDKIKVIKEIRAITGLGLKQSKDLVESAPATVKEDMPKADAEELIEKLKSVGAECKME